MEYATTEKPKKTKRGKPMVKKEKPTEIHPKTLEKFVGKVDNLWFIESKFLYHNRFRINVWTETYKEGYYSAFHKIEKSYFVHYVDGVIIDKTIAPKPKKERLF